MTLHAPNVGEVKMLQKILNQNLTLRLYSNNQTPSALLTAANFTEVVGGGYASKTLTYANWTIEHSTTSYGRYNAYQDFNFTGVTDAPGLIYGYYIIDPDGVLLWAERFAADELPFSPINGSLVRFRPRLGLNNA